MTDRVSATIVIGGSISAAVFAGLAAAIRFEGLSTEWDGEIFEPAHRLVAEPLRLCAHEVAWGRFGHLEQFCHVHGLPFARWAGGYPGQWSAERVVFTGAGGTASYMVDEGDRVVIDRRTVEALGSIEAVLTHFDAADFAVPPLVVEDDPVRGAADDPGSGAGDGAAVLLPAVPTE